MFRRLLAGAVCLAAGLACSSSAITVTTDFDREVDFTAIKTYGWVPMPDSIRASSTYDAKIREVVKNQLESKGVTEVETDPDVLLVYQGGLDEVQFVMDGQGWHWWGGWGGDVSVQEFKRGELVLHMMDPDQKYFIWEGRAQTEGQERPSVQAVGSAVSKMFSEYPPQPKSK
jgi:hypothetical protein